VLKHVPTDRPYDFSKELFPYLLEMGRPLYGYVMDGYWQDIGISTSTGRRTSTRSTRA
jgi:mannose-1-phosphate guanylyltransferase/phosphomannomutase